MTITTRNYGKPGDFELVSQFLIHHYLPENRDGNWLQPTWEYMHSHPSLDEASLGRIGIWENNGEITAVVNYESSLGEAFFQLHPQAKAIKPDLLDYAERNLYGTRDSGEKYLQAFINDIDQEFLEIVQARGYEHIPERDRPMMKFRISSSLPEIELPDGFRLKSLEEENNLVKIHRVLWRGFNHPGEPPQEEIEGRIKMQSGPNYRHDLNIVVEAPNGYFVAYSGLWFKPVNRYAYVEPVATDPDYRRLGLGRAAVLEGIRRCGIEGATVAYVGSDQAFYHSLGFEPVYTSQCWQIVFG